LNRTFDPATWSELSRHLGEALELTPASRPEYVERLRRERPSWAEELEVLLKISEEPAPILDAPAMAALSSHTAPSHIGAWHLLRLLGRGGMGEVWYAERSEDGFVQRAAIKFIPEPLVDVARRQRFAVERGILSRLQHPNIAQLIDGGEYATGMLWYAMEFVDGTDIISHCDAHRLDIEQRALLFGKLCQAVAFAHQHLIVHRDIKPRNVLVTADGQLKLIDFGIAKLLDIDSDALTQEASPMTPRYAAPEQLKGAPVTTASDIWQLGALLYELLTGAAARADNEADVPAPSRRVEKMPTQIAALRGVSPAELAKALRGDADAILLHALRDEPGARYGSAQQLADDVNCWLGGAAVATRRGERWYGMRRFWQRHWLPSSAFAAVFVALIVATIIAITFAQRSRRDATAAEHTLAAMRSMFLSDSSGPEAQDMSVSQLFANAVDVLRKDQNIPPDKRYALLRDISVHTIEVGQGAKGRQGLREAVAMAVAAFGPASLQALAEKTTLAKELAGYSPTPETIAEAGALLDETEPALRRMGAAGAAALLDVYRARVVVQIRRREFPAALQTAETLDRLTDTLPDYPARQRLDDRYMHVQALEWNDREHDALALLRKSITEAQESATAEPAVLGGIRWMQVQLCGTLPEEDAQAAIRECETELARMKSEKNDASYSGYVVRFAIARSHGKLKQYDAALDAGFEAKRILDQVADPKAADFTHAQFARFMGEMYTHVGRNAEAITFLERAMATATHASEDSRGARVELGIELAQNYATAGQAERARTLLEAQLPDIDKARQRYRDMAIELQSKLARSATR
jgi:serine/threonine protein kinase